MSIARSSVLYYPYIDIQDEYWLRSAALFWDSIRTIVPVSHRNPYSSAFACELNNEGILEPVRVQSDMDEIEGLTDIVLEYITDPASTDVIFDTNSNPINRIHQEKMPPYLLHLWEGIHPDKLPYTIRADLRCALDDENQWYSVTPGFANFYMTLLATRLSERLGLGLVTESRSADQLAIAVYKGKPLSQKRLGRHFEAFGPKMSLPSEVAPGLLFDTVVQSISLPKKVSAKKLLKFKRDHKEELALFRREITCLMADIPKETSVEALRQAVNDQYNNQVVPAMRSLKQSLQAQGWDAAFSGFLKAAFLSAPPTSAAIFAGFPSSLALIAGAGISITASVVGLVNQKHKVFTENPYSYLLSLERQW